jgi:methyltransferase
VLLHDSRVWYSALVAIVAIARLGELRLSRRHEHALRARGGHEVGAGHYPAMVAVHVGALVFAPLEVWVLDRPLVRPLAVAMLLLLAATFALRYWVIRTLGERWTTRVIVLPGLPLVSSGPFRFLRHPNYLAVALELPALALIHTAWIAAVVFGLLDLAVLRVRIAVEDRALRQSIG